MKTEPNYKPMLFNIPKPIANRLGLIAKEQGYTMTQMVVTGLQLYLLLYHGDKSKTDIVMSLINDNQTDIYDFLNEKS
jgi:hypothetical protein